MLEPIVRDIGACEHEQLEILQLVELCQVGIDNPRSPLAGRGIGGVKVTPQGRGTVKIATRTKPLLLKDVYWSPNAGVNLLSVGQLESKRLEGWSVGFGRDGGEGAGNGIWFQIHGHRFTSTKRNNVYFLDLQ